MQTHHFNNPNQPCDHGDFLRPNEASEQERKIQNLPHLPYRQLCAVCVEAKKAHIHNTQRFNNRKPVIQIAFACVSTTEQPGTATTIFTGIDVRTQQAMAAIGPSKSVNRYSSPEMKRVIYGTGRTQATLQCCYDNSTT